MIYKKMAAIMAEVEAIGKDRVNKEQNFKFRGIDDLYNTLHRLLSKNGVFILPEIIESRTEKGISKKGSAYTIRIVRVSFSFFAEDGSSAKCTSEGEAADYGDKATGKAFSMALKTALIQIFLIPTEDMEDPDGASVETATVDPKIMAVRKCQVPEELESYLTELKRDHTPGKPWDPALVQEIQKRKSELGVK